MGFRKYIIRNRDEDAWLVNIYAERDGKVFRFMPDAGMAMQFETKTEATRIAKECRGRVQNLKMDKSGRFYAE